MAPVAGNADLDSIADAGLNLFADDFMFPVMVISESALVHNIDTVARFCEDSGVSLSPHGKTSMSPELSHLQLEAGAWAITASTASQARIFRAFDIPRILIAHQVVDPAAVVWMADELDAHPTVELLCLIDSVAGVELMEAALAGRPAGRPIGVLVELGMTGGRTGCRTLEGAVAVADRIAASDRIRLVGVEGYEGILHFRGDDFSEVDEFLGRMRDLTEHLAAAGHFDHLDEVVVTAGGSMFPDRVVAILGSDWDIGRPVRPVIRPGGYATHDSKLYLDSGPFGVRPPMDTYAALRPAFTLWSYVVSRPEPDLALMGFGKRDASFGHGSADPQDASPRRRDARRRRPARSVRTQRPARLRPHRTRIRSESRRPTRLRDLPSLYVVRPVAGHAGGRRRPQRRRRGAHVLLAHRNPTQEKTVGCRPGMSSSRGKKGRCIRSNGSDRTEAGVGPGESMTITGTPGYTMR